MTFNPTFLRSAAALIAALIWGTSLPTSAAEFTYTGQGETRYGPHFRLEMTGVIEEGDADRLQAALASVPPGDGRELATLLSLDSPGGDFTAALALANLIAQTGLTTHLDADAVCLSGCALAFMAGRAYGEDSFQPRRIMSPSATLGFHAPFVFGGKLDDGIAPEIARTLLPDAERAAILSAADMVQLSLDEVLPVSLVRALLTYDASNFLYIETVDQAGRWQIDLAGAEIMSVADGLVTNDQRLALDKFCDNYLFWRFDIPLAERESDPAAGAFGSLNLQNSCRTEVGGDQFSFSYQNLETGEQDFGPVAYWQTLDPARPLKSLSPDEIAGTTATRSPFDPRDVPPSQVEGQCVQGFQWIGGWTGFAFEDAQAHATFRSCDGGSRVLAFTCQHGDTSLGIVIDAKYLPPETTNDVVTVRVDSEIFPGMLGGVRNMNGLQQYVASYGRNHPLFDAMSAGELITFGVLGAEITLHLADAEVALDALQASCR